MAVRMSQTTPQVADAETIEESPAAHRVRIVITAVAGVEMVLKSMGHPVKLGSGVAVAQELLMK